jgi:hypothetical protein
MDFAPEKIMARALEAVTPVNNGPAPDYGRLERRDSFDSGPASSM